VKPVSNSGVIDITPGSTDTFPPYTPVSNHIDNVPLSEPKSLDITPVLSSTESLSHLSDITPEPTIESTTITDTPPVIPAAEPESIQITPNNISPVQNAGPLAEDPDLVKLIK
jgi:hypothetical protein